MVKRLCFFIGLSCITYAQKRPNIIVFMVDDMGWQDTSLPFWTEVTPLNKLFRTPNMERLASEGMKFTNAYAMPVCTSSRASMISGVNAAQLRITNWTSPKKDNKTDQADDQFAAPDWNYNGVSPVANIPYTAHITALPQLLKNAGYFTVHVGKAHWGSAGTAGSSPYNLGFMVNIAGHSAGHPQSYYGEQFYGNMPGQNSWKSVPDLQEYYGTDTFLTEELTLEAIKSLEAPILNKQPFFLNLGHYAVHLPLMEDKRFYQKYIDAGLDVATTKYASMIEGMDKSLGDIMDYLEEKEVDKNTIIIFMSDNGGVSHIARGGEAHTQNLPLKAGKGSIYEGGIREPMIVKWPKITTPGSTAEQYIVIEDFFPTILEMARVTSYKTVQNMDGRTFVPILKNPNLKNQERAVVWHIPNKWAAKDGPGINFRSAIREGDWKLIYNMRDRSKELYNIKDDIGETENRANDYADRVKKMASQLANQLRAWNATMPIDKVSGKPVPMADEN